VGADLDVGDGDSQRGGDLGLALILLEAQAQDVGVACAEPGDRAPGDRPGLRVRDLSLGSAAGRADLRRLVVVQRLVRRPAPLPAQVAERGGDDDPVQPGGDLGVTAEARAVAMGGEERILRHVRGVLWVMEEAPRDRQGKGRFPLSERNSQIVHNVHLDNENVHVERNLSICWKYR
jgi:hypothetical protein